MKRHKALKNSKKALARILSGLLAITISVIVFTAAISAQAETGTTLKPHHQKAQYDVYAGGIHALQANLDVNLSKKDRYSTSLYAKTYGLLGSLAPWHGTFESHGWQGKVFKPEWHQSSATWRDELEVKRYSYNKDGSFREYTIKDEDNDGSPQEVDDELTQGTSDVLTGALNTMLTIAAGSDCSGETEVFDGKRRFKMIFRHQGEEELKASRWNVYAGPAIKCTVEVQPVAGKWHENPRGWMSIQEQGRERGTMPTVWFATMTKGEPAIPVKIRVKTSYGTLFMHMTDYESESKRLVREDD
jgi:hypothetical protein